MASIPVYKVVQTERPIYREGLSGKRLRFLAAGGHRSKKWVIALVERRGPTEFVVLQKAVAPYNEPNPGEDVLLALAKEFGLPHAPAKLSYLKAEQVKGL